MICSIHFFFQVKLLNFYFELCQNKQLSSPFSQGIVLFKLSKICPINMGNLSFDKRERAARTGCAQQLFTQLALVDIHERDSKDKSSSQLSANRYC